jgi:hypothetical protein
MERSEGKRAVRARFVAGLAVLLLAVGSGVSAAEYPRKVAIAPFAVLTSQEELQKIAPLFPRLLSSRLMALSGAEVLLLPAGEASPGEAAKKSGYSLLLTGSVAKLGAGYSIDVTATDLSGGKTAGAFFASAETIDAIIPRLGDLAADISEKLFGVQPAVRPTAPVAAQPQAGVPAVQGPASTVPVLPQAAVPGPQPVFPPAGPVTPGQGWDPSSLAKIGQSDKIVDELYGVVAGDTDAEGNGDVIAWGRTVLYFYRVKGAEVLPFTRITKELSHHFLGVAAVDIDGDGGKELLVMDLVGDDLESFILKKQDGVYREVAEKIPYFLAVLPDWQGKPVVVGQHAGFDAPFQGKIYRMTWDGKTLVPGDPLPADTSISPLSQGVLGLSSAKIGDGWKLIYTDETSRLRVLDSTGKSEFKSKSQYGLPFDFFEWGPYQPLEGKRKPFYLRRAVRAVSGEGRTWVLVPTAKSGLLSAVLQSYDENRVVLMRWDGGEFVEKATSAKSDRFHSGADFLSSSALRKGSKVIVSVIEQPGSAFKEKVSRLVLFGIE